MRYRRQVILEADAGRKSWPRDPDKSDFGGEELDEAADGVLDSEAVVVASYSMSLPAL